MKLKILLLSFLAVFLLMNPANATVLTFGDSVHFWPTWNSDDTKDWGTNDDGNDTIGHPDITGGRAVVDDNGNLTDVYIDYIGSISGVGAGALFLDVGANHYWDYALRANGVWKTNTPIYAYKTHPLDERYVVTDKWGDGTYWNIRNDHPYDVNISTDAGDEFISPLVFTGFSAGSGIVSWENFSIDLLNSPFIIGFGPTCANDVILEKVNPVPEPATMFLLGSGLIGLAAVGRKKFRKNNNS